MGMLADILIGAIGGFAVVVLLAIAATIDYPIDPDWEYHHHW